MIFTEAVENHRKMWNWIAEETKRREEKVRKSEYFSHKGIYIGIVCDCYCCEYAIQHTEENKYPRDCNKCPVVWGKNAEMKNAKCERENKEYSQWLYSEAWGDAYKYAKEIAELPIREMMEDEE